jgi:hypothetical protein
MATFDEIRGTVPVMEVPLFFYVYLRKYRPYSESKNIDPQIA